MDPLSDFEMEEMRGLAEKMGQRKKQAGGGRPSRIMVIGVIGVISLVIIFALLFRGGKNVATEETTAITERLNRLEQKQLLYEEAMKRMSELTDQVNALNKSISGLEGHDASMDNELGKISKQIALLKDKTVPEPKKTEIPAPAQKKTAPQTKRHDHEVQQGETLYAIAKKYGLSVDELRKLNNLSDDTAIHPGQKIIVK